MEDIPCLNNDQDIKNAYLAGTRFKIAPSMTHLDVWPYSEGKNEYFVEALRGNTSLRVIKFNRCFFTEPQSIASLITALKTSNTLEDLTIENFEKEIYEAVEQLLKETTSIKSLTLNGPRELERQVIQRQVRRMDYGRSLRAKNRTRKKINCSLESRLEMKHSIPLFLMAATQCFKQ